MKRQRLIVGLTGTFGAGKSTVARLLQRLGARQGISADEIAHEVFERKNPLYHKIKMFRS